MKALQSVRGVKPERGLPKDKMSKWAKIAHRVENDPDYSHGYFEQLKNDMKGFRENFEFEPGLMIEN